MRCENCEVWKWYYFIIYSCPVCKGKGQKEVNRILDIIKELKDDG